MKLPLIVSDYMDNGTVGVLDSDNRIIVGVDKVSAEEAAELVRAVNSHAKLLDLLKAYRDECECAFTPCPLCKEANKAIAEAEPKP